MCPLEARALSLYRGEVDDFALFGLEGNVDGLTTHLTVFYVGLRTLNARVKDHGDLLQAIGTLKKVFDFTHIMSLRLIYVLQQEGYLQKLFQPNT